MIRPLAIEQRHEVLGSFNLLGQHPRSHVWRRETVFRRLPSIREAPPEHVPLVVRTIGTKVFRCIACDHTGDADFIGARNILTKTLAALGRVLSPGQKMSTNQSDVSGQTVRRASAFATSALDLT